MLTPKFESRRHRISSPCLRTSRLFTLFLVTSCVPFVAINFRAHASDLASVQDQASVQGQATADKSVTSPSEAVPEVTDDALGDYHLAPGDHLAIAVFDQPQLSGDFFIDGGGELLLPVAGSVKVSGLTLAEAQESIQKKFADGVLVRPSVSVRIKEYRPIFVTGDVKRPGSYRFIFGESVKAAIATAGGEGQASEHPLGIVTDFVSAEERVRQLEADQLTLLVRKARLEAQRDERGTFVMPLLVGFDGRSVDFERVYSAENDIFARLEENYRNQLEALKKQGPRIEEEIKAVTEQIANQKERLDIVNGHLMDLQSLFQKGYLRKEVLLNQQIEKTLAQSQLSNLEAQVFHLRQTMGEIDVRLGDMKANYLRPVLGELQQTAQRLREIATTIGLARKLRDIKAEAASGVSGDAEYTYVISRLKDGRMVKVDATDETGLLPGDVVEVRRKQPDTESAGLSSTDAADSLNPSPTRHVAEQIESAAR
jgi:polysaccharide biosynthesis/export protein